MPISISRHGRASGRAVAALGSRPTTLRDPFTLGTYAHLIEPGGEGGFLGPLASCISNEVVGRSRQLRGTQDREMRVYMKERLESERHSGSRHRQAPMGRPAGMCFDTPAIAHFHVWTFRLAPTPADSLCADSAHRDHDRFVTAL